VRDSPDDAVELDARKRANGEGRRNPFRNRTHESFRDSDRQTEMMNELDSEHRGRTAASLGADQRARMYVAFRDDAVERSRHRQVLLHCAQRIEASLVGLEHRRCDLDLVSSHRTRCLGRCAEALVGASISLKFRLYLCALGTKLRRDESHEHLTLFHVAPAVYEDLRHEAVGSRV
jgi:hypothetical protein